FAVSAASWVMARMMDSPRPWWSSTRVRSSRWKGAKRRWTCSGGIPFQIQEDPRDYFPDQYLCTVARTGPDGRTQFPFVNVPEPLAGPTEEPWLVWYDCGLLYVYFDRATRQTRHIVDCM